MTDKSISKSLLRISTFIPFPCHSEEHTCPEGSIASTTCTSSCSNQARSSACSRKRVASEAGQSTERKCQRSSLHQTRENSEDPTQSEDSKVNISDTTHIYKVHIRNPDNVPGCMNPPPPAPVLPPPPPPPTGAAAAHEERVASKARQGKERQGKAKKSKMPRQNRKTADS